MKAIGLLICIFTLLEPVMMIVPAFRLPQEGGRPRDGCNRTAGRSNTVANLPWAVTLMLEAQNDNMTTCIGALVRDDWVLFAKNCYDRHVAQGSTQSAMVYAVNWDTARYGQVQRGRLSEYVMSFHNVSGGPLMLARLYDPFDSLPGLYPICLPALNENVRVGSNCFFSAWYGDEGIHEGGVNASRSRLILRMTVKSNAYCNRRAYSRTDIPARYRICATLKQGEVVTSRRIRYWGGVLSCVRGGKNYLYGVEHAPAASSQNFFNPSFFYKVSRYRNLIQTIIGRFYLPTVQPGMSIREYLRGFGVNASRPEYF